MLLKIKNAHPRDAHIKFDEGPHIYYIHGEQGYTSVTTWNHSHFAHFDANTIIEKIITNAKWHNDPTYAYYKMSKEAILAQWDANRDNAADLGTKMHKNIEDHYNGEIDISEIDTIEMRYFKRFLADFPELKPYRTEWCVYHEELKISGSIDMIFENPDGTLQIYDWKRCKEIAFESYGGKQRAITPCISHLQDTNFWHYSLQLNLYKTILETKYDKKITGLYLVCIHPDNPYKKYDRIQVPFLEKEMADLMVFRKEQLVAMAMATSTATTTPDTHTPTVEVEIEKTPTPTADTPTLPTTIKKKRGVVVVAKKKIENTLITPPTTPMPTPTDTTTPPTADTILPLKKKRVVKKKIENTLTPTADTAQTPPPTPMDTPTPTQPLKKKRMVVVVKKKIEKID